MNNADEISSWKDRQSLPTWVDCSGWRGPQRSGKITRLRQMGFTRNYLLAEHIWSSGTKSYCIHRYRWREDGFIQVWNGWGDYSSVGRGLRYLCQEERKHQEMVAELNEVFKDLGTPSSDADLGMIFPETGWFGPHPDTDLGTPA